MSLIIYTDGACKGNGKAGASAGGYGVYIDYGDGRTRHIWGGEADSTNNRMELMAAIVALQATQDGEHIQLWTDSAYVKNGISSWIHGWKKKNWKKADGKPVLNQSLWQTLDALTATRQIDWQWIKGHAGHAGNEMADSLANRGVTGSGDVLFDSNGTLLSQDATTQNTVAQNPISQNPTSQNLASQSSTTQGAVPQNTTANPPSTADDSPSTKATQIQAANPANATVINTTTNTASDTTTMTSHFDTNSSFTANTSPTQAEQTQTPVYDGDTSRANPYFVPSLPVPINRGKLERQLIMDTETTGFDDQNGDRIVEVGMIEMVGRKFTGEKLHVYINPEKIMDEEVIRVHGIANEFVADKPKFADVAAQIYEFAKGAQIIAHNAAFDMRFLKMEFERAGFADFDSQVDVIDTLALAKQMYPGQRNSLDALVKRLDVGHKDRTFHGALLDSEILAEVYLAMTGGQVELDINEEGVGTGAEHKHENLSHLASMLVRTQIDEQADAAWRAAIFK